MSVRRADEPVADHILATLIARQHRRWGKRSEKRLEQTLSNLLAVTREDERQRIVRAIQTGSWPKTGAK